MKRDFNLRNKILFRDLGICRCCGFKATEVHHITPLIYGGKDEAKNMISLCHFCHKHAPNTKEEFKDYMYRNGAKYEYLLGSCINRCLIDDMDINKIIPFFRKMIQALREIDFNNAMEEYNVKKYTELEIEDIDL